MRKRPLTFGEAVVLGTPYDAGGGIVITPPTVRQIIQFDEPSYYKIIGLLTCISSDCKAALEDIGLDWVTITDFEMFVLASRSLAVEDTEILFGSGLDFSRLEFFADEQNKAGYLQSADGTYRIDEGVYKNMTAYLCKMHQIAKKPEFPGNDYARKMLLQESRDQMRTQKEDKPILPTLISYVANVPGSKYNYEQCLDMSYSTFMDCVARLQVIEQSNALRSACYSGFVDTSKIDKSELNALREIVVTGAKPNFTIRQK